MLIPAPLPKTANTDPKAGSFPSLSGSHSSPLLSCLTLPHQLAPPCSQAALGSTFPLLVEERMDPVPGSWGAPASPSTQPCTDARTTLLPDLWSCGITLLLPSSLALRAFHVTAEAARIKGEPRQRWDFSRLASASSEGEAGEDEFPAQTQSLRSEDWLLPWHFWASSFTDSRGAGPEAVGTDSP